MANGEVIEHPNKPWCALLPKLSSASTLKPEPVSNTLQYKSGARYDGQFLQDLKVGYGLFIWPDGACYEGEFVNDARHGRGRQEWPDGSSYKGEFLKDQRHGEGVQKWANGEKYAGQFYRDYRHGVGRYTWADKSSFEGMFFLGRKEGYGTFNFANGASFAGLYKNDEREGPGVMTYGETEQQDVGLWRRQQLVRTCESLPGFFYLADSNEYREYVDEEQVTRRRIKLDSTCPNPMRVIDRYVNPPKAFRHEYEPDIHNKVEQIFSNALHTRSLAMDMRSFYEACTAGFLSERMRKSGKMKFTDTYAVVWNKTPSCVAMQKHILTYKPSQQDAGFPVKSVLFGNKRDKFGRAGWLEISSGELHEAAQIGDLATVNRLVNGGDVHVDVADLEGNTPLLAASIHGYLDVINALLDNGADVNHLNNEGLSALAACYVKLYSTSMFRYNIAEKDLERPADFQQEPDYEPLSATPSRRKGTKKNLTREASKQSLSEQTGASNEDSSGDAVGNSNKEQVGRLHPPKSKRSKSPTGNELNSSEIVETQFNISEGLQPEVLADSKAVEVFDIDASERQLMQATINLLLRRGADPDASTMPMPALFFAVKACDVEAVKFLLLKGASVNSKLSEKRGGLNALHIASAMPGEEGIEMTELLLDSLVYPDVRAAEDDAYIRRKENEEFDTEEATKTLKLSGGRTPLHIACSRQDNYQNAALVVRALLQHNANPDLLCNGYSPLAIAIMSGNDLAIEELLRRGANPSLPLGDGIENALCVAAHTACESRRSPEARIKLIDKLIDAGADILNRVRIGSEDITGTVVDYAFHVHSLDQRIGHLPYRALKPHEREIYNARRAVADHLGHTLRTKAFEKRQKDADDTSRTVTKGGLAKKSETVNFCGDCGRSVNVKLTPCMRCKQVYYCSKACKTKAWEAGHKDECSSMEEIRKRKDISPSTTADMETKQFDEVETMSEKSLSVKVAFPKRTTFSLDYGDSKDDEESVVSSESDETYQPVYRKKTKTKVQWDIIETTEEEEEAIPDSDYGSDTDEDLQFLKKLTTKQQSDTSLHMIDTEQVDQSIVNNYALAKAALLRKKSDKLRKRKKRALSKGILRADEDAEEEFDMTRESDVELYAIMKEIRMREGSQKEILSEVYDDEESLMSREVERKRSIKREEIKRKKQEKEKAIKEKMMRQDEERQRDKDTERKTKKDKLMLKTETEENLFLYTSDTDVQMPTSDEESPEKGGDEEKTRKKTKKMVHEKEKRKDKKHRHLGDNEVFSFFAESESERGDTELDYKKISDTQDQFTTSFTDDEDRGEEIEKDDKKRRKQTKKERKSRKDKKGKIDRSPTDQEESDDDRHHLHPDTETDVEDGTKKPEKKSKKKSRKREKKAKEGIDKEIKDLEDISEKSTAQDMSSEKGSKERKPRKVKKDKSDLKERKSRKSRKKGSPDQADVQPQSDQEILKDQSDRVISKGRKDKAKIKIGKSQPGLKDEKDQKASKEKMDQMGLKTGKDETATAKKVRSDQKPRDVPSRKDRATKKKAKVAHDVKVILHYKDIKEKKRLRAGKIVKEETKKEKEPKKGQKEKEEKMQKKAAKKIRKGEGAADETAMSDAESSEFGTFSELASIADVPVFGTTEDLTGRGDIAQDKAEYEDEEEEGKEEGRRSTAGKVAKRRDESLFFMGKSGRALYTSLVSAAKGGCGSRMEEYKDVYREKNIKSRWFVPAPSWVKGRWRSKSAEREGLPKTQGGTYLPQVEHGYTGNYSYV